MATITVNINLMNSMMFVELVAKEFANMFNCLVNSCSTFADINAAKIMCQKFIEKDHEFAVKNLDPMLRSIFKEMGLDIDVNDLTVEEYREIQDLVMCHAAVHITLL